MPTPILNSSPPNTSTANKLSVGPPLTLAALAGGLERKGIITKAYDSYAPSSPAIRDRAISSPIS